LRLLAFNESKSRANSARGDCLWQTSGAVEKSLGACAQHSGAAPKDEARDGAPFGDALDNEIDRRYEQPLIEAAR
jgi:hypothetical protein